MAVEDVFSISGRGTVATGRCERGIVTKGAEVEIVGYGPPRKTVLTGIGRLLWISQTLAYTEQKCSTRSWTVERPETTWVLSFAA